jgi:hypothetical protein
MADALRVTVAKRDGKPFPRARVSLVPDGTAPAFVDADENGRAIFPLKVKDVMRLTVTHPSTTTALAAAATWQRSETAYWPVSTRLILSETGHVVMERTPQLSYFASAAGPSGTLQDIELRLFRVRRIDDVANAVLSQIGRNYPLEIKGEQPPNLIHTYSQSPLLDGSDKAQRGERPRPTMDPRVASLYEVAARKDPAGNEEKPFAPKCVGVWLPRQVMRQLDQTPPPILVYFRPQANQDFQGQASGYPDPVPKHVTTAAFQLNRYDAQPYSKAHYYFDWFFFKTFEFVQDPWKPEAVFAMGFRNQIKAAGRRVGLIAPVPEAGASGLTHGHAIEPEFLAELIAEILAFVDVDFDPGNSVLAPLPPGRSPGRVAVTAHSNGNDVMAAFIAKLGSAPKDNLLRQKLREIYLLDPAGGGEGGAFDVCASYLQSLGAPDEVALRCYGQNAFLHARFPDLHKAFARPGHPPKPYDLTAEQLSAPAGGLPHRTAAFLPAAAWPEPPVDNVFNSIHSMIPATMVTHALLLSAFPKL